MSVVVPFRGDEAGALEAARALRRLELGPDDQLIVADNTDPAIATPALDGVAEVVHAAAEASSYHARNAGAAVARCEWLLFMDADCVPEPGLLGRYFEPPAGDRVGVVAGTIAENAAETLLARYAVSRNLYRGTRGGDGDGDEAGGGYAPTGNLLVRREAFEAIGGFTEGIRSAGDVELCWRAQAAGWTLERRPHAVVLHRHREDLRSFLAMLARYGAGAGWLNTRYPGSAPRWPLSPRELARSGIDSLRHGVAGERDEAAFRLVDALGLIAHNVGYRSSNAVPRDSA